MSFRSHHQATTSCGLLRAPICDERIKVSFDQLGSSTLYWVTVPRSVAARCWLDRRRLDFCKER